MALAKKRATTIVLDAEDDRLLSRAARERGVSRSEFIRQQLALVLEQYRRHPKPRSAGVIRALSERATRASYSVASGSASALICDTGALLDYLVEALADTVGASAPSLLGTSATSPRFGYATAGRLNWSSTRRIPINFDIQRRGGAVRRARARGLKARLGRLRQTRQPSADDPNWMGAAIAV